MKRLLTGLLFVFFAVALAQSVTYKNAAAHFQMDYPKGWVAKEGIAGTTVFVTKVNKNGFSTNASVVTQQVPKGTTLKALKSGFEQQLSTVITDFKLLSQKDTMLGGEPALAISYTGRQGKYALTWYQVVVIRGTTNYILTFTAETSVYPSQNAIVSGVVGSFKFI